MPATYVGFTGGTYAENSWTHTLTGGNKSRMIVVLLHYVQPSNSALPANITFDGNNMTLQGSAVHGTDPNVSVGVYTIEIADDDSGAKTVDVSGGTHGAHHMAIAIEVAGIVSVAQVVTDTGEIDITPTGVAGTSIVLGMASIGGFGGFTLDSGADELAHTEHNDAANEWDNEATWWKTENPASTFTVEFTTAQTPLTTVAIELNSVGAQTQIITAL